VKLARSLRRTAARRAESATVIEGLHLLDALLDSARGPRRQVPAIRFFLFTAVAAARCAEDGRLDRLATLGVEGGIVADRDFHSISDTESPQGILLVIDRPEPVTDPPADCRRLLLADGIADPGNLGTLIRSAAAFGFDGVYTVGGVDAFAPKVLRASVGACFAVRLGACSAPAAFLSTCVERRMAVVAAVTRDGEPPRDAGSNFVLVVGSESHGVSPELLALATRRVTVPIHRSVESLNAGVAGSILMHALTPPGDGGVD
jgi:TrmH family RNA methyltransferase